MRPQRIVTSLFFVVVFSFMCVPDSSSNDSTHDMNTAGEYLKMGMYLEAVDAYLDVADNSADYNMRAKAILRIGDIYSYFLNNYDVALRQYALVAGNYPESLHAANAYFNTGMILYEKNRYQEALAWFKKYVDKFPAGPRKTTAEFMIETCMHPPPAVEKKRDVVREIQTDQEIRVLIHENIRRMSIGAYNGYEIRDLSGRRVIAEFAGGRSSFVEFRRGRIHLDGILLNDKNIVVSSPGKGMVAVNGKMYRGEIIIAQGSGDMKVVNHLKLEEYLYGVIPREMSPEWPLEALKAQAVAARTYALYQRDKNKDKNYDVYATAYSQMYGGYDAENEMTTKAVNETKGKVILHEGQLILAYFHSNSGGITEDAKHVWTADVPYLRGVRDDFSTGPPNYQWNQYIDLSDIERSLRTNGVDVGSISRMIPLEFSPSGRIKKIRIVHNRGETTLTGNHFRIKIDPKTIKSTLFTMSAVGNGVRILGKGYGHGVGMSQWGAYGMAGAGYTYGDILRHYYPGVEVR